MSDSRAVSVTFGFAFVAIFVTGCARGPSAHSARSPNGQGIGVNGAQGTNGPSAENGGSGGDSDDTTISAPDASHDQRGFATWYGAQFAGKPTASGERFDPDAMTAAHRKLHFGTWVDVTRLDGSNRSVRVRINDRGPFGHTDRVIDLSRHAAQILGIVKDGSGEVSIRIVDGP